MFFLMLQKAPDMLDQVPTITLMREHRGTLRVTQTAIPSQNVKTRNTAERNVTEGERNECRRRNPLRSWPAEWRSEVIGTTPVVAMRMDYLRLLLFRPSRLVLLLAACFWGGSSAPDNALVLAHTSGFFFLRVFSLVWQREWKETQVWEHAQDVKFCVGIVYGSPLGLIAWSYQLTFRYCPYQHCTSKSNWHSNDIWFSLFQGCNRRWRMMTHVYLGAEMIVWSLWRGRRQISAISKPTATASTCFVARDVFLALCFCSSLWVLNA